MKGRCAGLLEGSRGSVGCWNFEGWRVHCGPQCAAIPPEGSDLTRTHTTLLAGRFREAHGLSQPGVHAAVVALDRMMLTAYRCQHACLHLRLKCIG